MPEQNLLADVEAAARAHYGHEPVRASVSFVGVQPIEVLRFEPDADERVYLSLGMSRHPMTAADAPIASADGPRAELVLHVRDPGDLFLAVWKRVAVLAAAPAVEGVVYRPGMTADLGEPLAAGCACTGVLIAESPVGAVGTRAGVVDVLQVLPATSSELAWCRVRGGDELRRRWRERGTDLTDLARATVELG